MDPVLKTELVKISYWTCNIPAHRHQSPDSASSCMKKKKGIRGQISKISRNLKIISQLQKGRNCEQISLEVNCSSSNLIKAVNSSLKIAYDKASANGATPFKRRHWITKDFTNPEKQSELIYLTRILEEHLAMLKAE